jgi:dihydroorotase (multifunctional complex type)
MSLVIRNAKIVFPDRIFEGGLVAENGKITEVLSNSKLPKGDENIDAKGLYLLPGIIDVHTHLREPGTSFEEDWHTGSAAAAAGGVTTVLDMPDTQPPVTTVSLLQEKRAIAASKSTVDYGFHFAAAVENADELRRVENVASVKFYMCSTASSYPIHGDYVFLEEMKVKNDYVFYEDLRLLSERGIMATVHAENNAIADYLKDKYIKAGRNDPMAYADSRPPICAAEAAGRAALLARIAGAKMHLVHVSTGYELEILERNKNFQPLSSEAATYHLFLSADDYKKRGGILKTTPPLRSKEDQTSLWKSIQNGVIDIVTSDHMPTVPESKEGSVWTSAAGVPGLETMLPLLLNEVAKKNLSINRLVSVTSENPARIFELKDKGRIEAGYDADCVLVDLDKEFQIRNDAQYTKCGWTPYDGWKVSGAVVKTVLRGNVIYDSGELHATKGREVSYL